MLPVESQEQRHVRLAAAAGRINLDRRSGRFERYLQKAWQYLVELYGEDGFDIVVEGISPVTHVYVVAACSLEKIPRWTVFIAEVWRIRNRPSYGPLVLRSAPGM